MAKSGDRHRRGPGGPSRPTRSGRATPPTRRRHRPEVDGLVDPTLDRMVETLLGTARDAIGPDHPAPAIALEQWAHELALTSFDAEAMPREFYVDLGRLLTASTDPLAPAALAALAVAVGHPDAAPLRKARATWLSAGAGSDPSARDTDLGIGREVPVAAITVGAEDEAQASVIIGFAAAGTAHAIGLLVDDAMDGLGRDLFVGPPVEVIELDASSDPDLVVTEISVTDAAALALSALAVTEEEAWDDPQDLALLPLVTRHLALIS